ncbi:methyltransferase domain-containing protein [Rheinheimera baltica]|uniref:Methyltransferase domain-containing protein n=1 Tax=Rheinheimera baltica TaxID=67576 RepID=A0ABT9HUE3_9GAMM|nr:methyltransferase domain-containing protein [Rheinheimera baltica]MDP5134754.1 methyltransferase domain-containing protein [Rheinheimera baltica]
MEGSFKPRSAGVLKDIDSGIDLENDHPFFNSHKEADLFVESGIVPYLNALPQSVRYLDFGGGQGLLASKVQKRLGELGFQCEVAVVDGNCNFIAQARNKGISGVLANLEEYQGHDVDLVTMRMVNHYNDALTQAVIAKNVYESLKTNGLLVIQFESGSVMACEMRNAIADLLARFFPAVSYYWPPIQVLHQQMQGLGFQLCGNIDSEPSYSQDITTLLRNAWQRHAADNCDPERQQAFFTQAADLILTRFSSTEAKSQGLYESQGRFYMETCYPIGVFQK